MPLLIKRPETVLGHSLPEPRITLVGALLLALAVSIPVLLLGSLLDLFVQWIFGVCVGLWCMI